MTSLCLYHLEEYSLHIADYNHWSLVHLEPPGDGLGLVDLRPVGVDVELVKAHHRQLVSDRLKGMCRLITLRERESSCCLLEP